MNRLSKRMLSGILASFLLVFAIIFALEISLNKKFDFEHTLAGASERNSTWTSLIRSLFASIKYKFTEGKDRTGSVERPSKPSQMAFELSQDPAASIRHFGPMMIWIVPSSTKVRPSDPPGVPATLEYHLDHLKLPFLWTALKGETISWQVVLRATKPVSDVHVHYTTSLSKECYRISRFLEWYVPVPFQPEPKFVAGPPGYYPDPLIPLEDPYNSGRRVIGRIGLNPNMNKAIWFNLHIRKGCASGTYSGHVEVLSGNAKVYSKAIDVHVVNALLPDQVPLERWIQLYTWRFVKGEGLNPQSLEFQSILNRYRSMADKYGFALNDQGEILPLIRWDKSTGDIGMINWSRYDSLYEDYLSGHLLGHPPNVYCLPIKPYFAVDRSFRFGIWGNNPSPLEQFEGLPSRVVENLSRAIVQHWKDKGWPIDRGFTYIFDEPMHQSYYHDIYKLIRLYSIAVKKGSGGKIRFMLTDSPPNGTPKSIKFHKDVLLNHINIWAMTGDWLVPSILWKRQKEGEHGWVYQMHPPFIGGSNLDDTGPGFRVWFWTAYKYRLNGVFLWNADQWGNGNKISTIDDASLSPYFTAGRSWDRDNPGNGIMFYPGHQLHFLHFKDIDGPVPSIRMEQWRRGWEDYRILWILKDKTEVAPYVDRAVQRALNDKRILPPWNDSRWGKPGLWEHDPVKWHEIRVQMEMALEKASH